MRFKFSFTLTKKFGKMDSKFSGIYLLVKNIPKTYQTFNIGRYNRNYGFKTNI